MAISVLRPDSPVGIVLAHLEHAKRSGAGWVARCPAHEDREPSLSITEGRDGRALLNCHAGCDTRAICTALGLDLKDLFPPDTARATNVMRATSGASSVAAGTPATSVTAPAARPQWLEKTYDYVDGEGRLLFQVCRFRVMKDGTPGKTFRQRRRAPNGSDWVWGLGDVEPVLYRLPELLAGVESGKRVYIAEGEKDVEALRGLGLVATTSPMGAGKWRERYAEALVGADVAILPDNDEVGQAHAAQIAASLLARGAVVRIVALPNLPPKGDVSDWVQAGGTLAQLEQLIEATPPTTAEELSDTPGALPRAVRLLDAPEPEPLTWAVESLWVAGEIGLLVGDGGSFKSTAALAMAGAMAGGYPVWGKFAAAQRPALIVSAEDSISVVLMRLRALIRGHGWDATRVLANLHVVATPDATLSDPRWQDHLLREAERVSAGMVVLDPWADLIGGDENSNSDARPVIKWARRLGAETGAAVPIVHHAGKQGQDKRALDRIRGASALPSGARTILFFEFQPTGVLVEHLKMSRAPKLESFVLTRKIESDPANRALWTSARLTYETERTATLSRAEEFVLAQITASPRRLTTSDLKKMVAGVGISGEDISSALKSLRTMLRIDYEEGPRKAHLWYPRTAAAPSPSAADPSRTGPFPGRAR